MGVVTPLLTNKKVLEITYQTPYENLQDTPTSLPTSEPTDPQISYTVAESDLPTLSMGVESKVIIALMYAGGKNTDSSSQTVYVRMLKNGSNVYYKSYSVSANYYWTARAYFHDVAVGDTLSLKLWASSSNVNWDYEARQLQFSRVALFEKYPLYEFKISGIQKQPQLSQGNPSVMGYSQLSLYYYSGDHITTDTTINLSPWRQHATYKLFRIGEGDSSYANKILIYSRSNWRPYYFQNYVPTKIELRALRRLV